MNATEAELVDIITDLSYQGRQIPPGQAQALAQRILASGVVTPTSEITALADEYDAKPRKIDSGYVVGRLRTITEGDAPNA